MINLAIINVKEKILQNNLKLTQVWRLFQDLRVALLDRQKIHPSFSMRWKQEVFPIFNCQAALIRRREIGLQHNKLKLLSFTFLI